MAFKELSRALDKIEENMKKTGNTPFEFESLQIEMNEAIFMPMKALNQLSSSVRLQRMVKKALLKNSKRQS